MKHSLEKFIEYFLSTDYKILSWPIGTERNMFNAHVYHSVYNNILRSMSPDNIYKLIHSFSAVGFTSKSKM